MVHALWLIAAPSHTPPKLRSEDYGQHSWRARRLFQSLQHDYHTRRLRCHTCRPKVRQGETDLENTDRGGVRMGGGGVRLGEPPRRSSPPAPATERAGCASDPDPIPPPPVAAPTLTSGADENGTAQPCLGATVAPPTGEGTRQTGERTQQTLARTQQAGEDGSTETAARLTGAEPTAAVGAAAVTRPAVPDRRLVG